MAEHPQTPRPHGDPLRETVEPQRQSDAPADASRTGSDGEAGRGSGPGSTANRTPAADEDDGQTRRRQYSEGAEIVSKID